MEANLETGATELSVDDAAEALLQRMESDAPTEENNEPESTEEVVEVEETDSDTPEEVDVEQSEDQETKSDEEALTFESISDLAEALEITPEAFLEQFKGKVKVDGEESEISLSEALNGYQRQSDYQRKTAELAEQRRQAEAALAQQHSEIAQRKQLAQASLQAAENVLMQEFEGVNWAELESTDPGTAALYRQKFQARQAEIQQYQQQLMQQRQYEAQALEQQRAQQYQEYLVREKETLAKVAPDWNEATSKQVINYLSDNGFSQDEVASLSDHRHAIIARKAMLYDQQQKSVDVAKAKVKPLPKMLKPNAKSNKTAKQQQTAKLKAKLKRSGSVDDAAALILERMG